MFGTSIIKAVVLLLPSVLESRIISSSIAFPSAPLTTSLTASIPLKVDGHFNLISSFNSSIVVLLGSHFTLNTSFPT